MWIKGIWFLAMLSSGHNVISEMLMGLPVFTKASVMCQNDSWFQQNPWQAEQSQARQDTIGLVWLVTTNPKAYTFTTWDLSDMDLSMIASTHTFGSAVLICHCSFMNRILQSGLLDWIKIAKRQVASGDVPAGGAQSCDPCLEDSRVEN